MIIFVHHNNQKIKLILINPSLSTLYKLVQDNLKLPFDFELRNKLNKIVYDLYDGLEVYVVEIQKLQSESQLQKSKTMNEQNTFRNGRDRIHSLNVLSSNKKYSHSEFSSPNDLSSMQSSKKEMIVQKIMEDKQYREEQQKINLEGNKLIKQIQKRIKLKEQVQRLKDEALNYSELEKKKLILAQKRELSQPIRLEALTEHQKKYEEEKQQKLKQRQQIKQELEEEFKSKLIKFPKSQALLRLEEEQARLKLQQHQNQEIKKQLREKQLKYGDNVKESFLKDVQRQSISPIKPALEASSQKQSQLDIAQSNIKKLQNLLDQKQYEKILLNPDRRSVNDIRPRGQHSLLEAKKLEKIVEYPKPQTTENKILVHKRKSLLKQQNSELISSNFPHSLNEIKPIQFEEKYQSVLKQVWQMEQKCKEREKKILFNKVKPQEEEENDKYVENIKQKLALIA